MDQTAQSANGTPVSATPARAATVSAALRKAGFTRSTTKKAPGVRFPVPTPGFHVQQRQDHVRVSSTFSGTPVQRYADALTKAGYIVEDHADLSGVVLVYRAVDR